MQQAGNQPTMSMSGLSVVSFNTWGMPYASTDVLTRPGRCAADVADALEPSKDTVVCFQEVWAFRCGIGWPLLALARAYERCLSPRDGPQAVDQERSMLRQVVCQMNSWLTLLALNFGVLTALLLPLRFLRWDGTRSVIARDLARCGLKCAVGLGGRAGMPWLRLMDSGLLLVSSAAPMRAGFVAYAATGGLRSEGMVTKGLLWALLPAATGPTEDGGRLVVTTHLHATSAPTRLEQCAQLLEVVEGLCAELRPALVVICGDLNEPPGGPLHAKLCASPLGLERVSDAHGEGTALGDGAELDHVYAASPTTGRVSHEALPPVFTPNSDHAMVRVACLKPATPS